MFLAVSPILYRNFVFPFNIVCLAAIPAVSKALETTFFPPIPATVPLPRPPKAPPNPLPRALKRLSPLSIEALEDAIPEATAPIPAPATPPRTPAAIGLCVIVLSGLRLKLPEALIPVIPSISFGI